MSSWVPKSSRIRQLQLVVQGVGLLSPQEFLQSLDCVMHEEHWRKYKTRDGNSFDFFEQWVAYPQPEGLGVTSQHGAEYLRDMLLGVGRIRMWAPILDYIRVKPGRRVESSR